MGSLSNKPVHRRRKLSRSSITAQPTLRKAYVLPRKQNGAHCVGGKESVGGRVRGWKGIGRRESAWVERNRSEGERCSWGGGGGGGVTTRLRAWASKDSSFIPGTSHILGFLARHLRYIQSFLNPNSGDNQYTLAVLLKHRCQLSRIYFRDKFTPWPHPNNTPTMT